MRELTNRDGNGDDASDTQLALKKIDSYANFDGVGPDLVHGLEPLHDTLDVGAHERHRRRGVNIFQRQRACLAVDDGYQARANHAYCAVCSVLVLAHRHLFCEGASVRIIAHSERALAGNKTYRNPNIDEKVRPNEAVPNLSCLMGDRLLRQSDGTVDQERLAEVERCEAGSWWDSLEEHALDDAK